MKTPISATKDYAHLIPLGAKNGKKAKDEDYEEMKAEEGDDDGEENEGKKGKKAEEDNSGAPTEKPDRAKKATKKTVKAEDEEDEEEEEEEDEDEKNNKDKEKESKERCELAETGTLRANARQRERARCAAIFSSKAASGRPDVAAKFAFNTSMTAKEAISVMDSLGLEASESRKKVTLSERMRDVRNPEITDNAPAFQPQNGSSLAAAIVAAGQKTLGISA